MNFLLPSFFGIDGIAQTLVKLFRTLMLLLCTIVYKLVMYVYDIFIRLGTGELLTNTQIQKIYSRVTLVIGLFMLFKLMFSFVQYLLDPSKMDDKNGGAAKLILKCVIVVALLGTTPYIFQGAYKLQDLLLESNVIGKVILGDSNADANASNFGPVLASDLFLSFYTFAEGEEATTAFEWQTNLSDAKCSAILGEDMEILRDEIMYSRSFSRAWYCLNQEPAFENDFVIDFAGHGLYALAVGIFVLYVMVVYCLDVGLRVIQLAFLQLIAPIPILSYLGEDKDGAFSKWVKRCLSTFLDLFIRLAIIYLVVFLISNLINNTSGSWDIFMISTGDPRGFTKLLIKTIIILSLLMFAKKAPDLLKELLPQGIGGQDYGFSLKKAKENYAPLGRAVGAGVSAVSSGTVSGISRFNTNRRAGRSLGSSLLGAAGGVAIGFATGGVAGAKKGNMFKNIGSAVNARRTADNKYNELINSGGNTVGKFLSKVTDFVGETKGQKYTRIMNDAKAIGKYRDDAYTAAEKISAVSAAKDALGHIQQEPGETIEQFRRRQSRMSNSVDNMADAAFNAAADGKSYYSWLEEDAFDISGIIDPHKKFSFDSSSYSTGNSLADFANAKAAFEASLDAQIMEYSKNGGDASSIDKNAIMKDFNDSWVKSNGTAKFDYEIGTDHDYKDAVKRAFEEKIKSQLVSYEYDINNNPDISAGDKQKLILEMNSNLSTQLSNFDASWERAVQTGITEIEYKVNSIAKFSSSDDRRVAQVQSNMSQAKSYAEATNAVFYDRSDNTWKSYEFNNGEDFRSAGKKRDNTVSEITSQSDYQSAIANDKAGGVDSNASSKK